MGLSIFSLRAQDSTAVRFRGQIFDSETKSAISYFMIINKNSGSGTFGDASGSFLMDVNIQDTIMIGAHGYTTEKFIVPRPLDGKQDVYEEFYLDKLKIVLPEVVIIPERELKEIKKDIDKLGYDEKDYRISGVNALEHPITFLYQMFSKRERSYRKVIELENEVKRRELLKELFERYFDDFIDYCNISDAVLQNTSQNEFIEMIKTRFKGFQIYSKRKKASPLYQKIHNE